MTAHDTRTKSFSAAGDRSHIGWCDTCNRSVGKPTTDRDTAQADADRHAANGVRAVGV